MNWFQYHNLIITESQSCLKLICFNAKIYHIAISKIRKQVNLKTEKLKNNRVLIKMATDNNIDNNTAVEANPVGGKHPNAYKIPILLLNDIIIFPYTLSPLVVDGKATISLLENIVAGDRLIALFPVVTQLSQNPDLFYDTALETFTLNNKQISSVGVLGRIVKMLKFPDGTVRILVRGLKRIKYLQTVSEKEPFSVKAEDLKDETVSNIEMTAMVRNAITQFQEIISTSPFYPEELKVAILNIEDNSRLVDLIADTLNISYMEKLHLLASADLHGRLQLLSILLNRELEVLHVGTKIQSQVSSALGKSQREFFLREQLRTIKKELGEDFKNPDIKALEERLLKVKLPEKADSVVRKEMSRLESIPQASAEYNVAHTYIDWILSLPWNVFTDDRIDIDEALKILNEDHYDLKDVKERILDFLAVLQLKKDKKSPILCFIGPPGVGKTSLGQSIARAMKRKFVRVSLGGIKDEAEIRGHRRTYVGSLPGRIIQGIKRAQSANPVFMLDEIDKIGTDFRGDPASALLEVLDPQQNAAFNDHYIELDYDLSSVMFIATGNITDTIPPALMDRMEILRLPGYTATEKKQIAKQFLIPRQIKENGLMEHKISFPINTVDKVITLYTREAGVRNLERSIATICRKIARKIVQNKKISVKTRTVVKPESLSDFLGPQKFFKDEAEHNHQVGIVTGMAWTSTGGSILPVEVTFMPGKGHLKLTGSLGEIMKESAEAAFSFVKSRYEKLNIDPKKFTENDFHIHVPDGATPKDGPSAGITILSALISSITHRPARRFTAMTGEITLLGKVTPVGGIKEKVIAAFSAGIKTVILPEKNQKDLIDIPDEVKSKLTFVYVKNAVEAVERILLPARKIKQKEKDRKQTTDGG